MFGDSTQSEFQFILRVFSVVEIRALCRSLEFFHSNLGKPCFHEFMLYTGVMLCWYILNPLVIVKGKLNATAYKYILKENVVLTTL